MEEYRATFEIESKTDAYAVERMLNQLFDSVREEARTIRDETSDSSATIEEFAAIRDAARRPTPGRLRVVYERREGEFEG